MGFLMDGLDAEAYDRKYNDSELVRRILRYFRPEAGRIQFIAFLIVLNSLINTGLPVLISRFVDQLKVAPQSINLTQVTLIFVGLGIIAWACNAVRRWFSSQSVGNVVLKMREDAFDAVMKRDLSFYDQFPSGKIVSRVTSDTAAFSQVVTLAIDLLSQLLLVVILMGYLFSVNTRLAFITVLLAPLIIATALAFRKIARTTITNSRRVSALVSSHVQETVSGIGVAKAFRQEQAIYDEFLEVNKQSYRLNLRTGYVFSGIFPILNIVAGIGTAALVYFGGQQAVVGEITPGNWYLFIQGIALFWFPLTSIASFWSQFQIGLAAGERVFALIDAEPKVVQIGDAHPAHMRGNVQFRNMKFSYKEGESVLDNFSLDIQAGKMLALVGHTGSGKSSLAKLIARFYEYQGGELLIDGMDIRQLNLGAYRSRLGIVTQTPFLFDGTVRENIRYGRANATNNEVEAVAMRVAGGDWLKNLPQGLDTEVGERGNNLSMGQRQLVALTRVLLQDPLILILDEATASIDPLTETLIQEGLDEVLKNRTSIVIAHRLSTIRHADRIIVLRKGEIIEEGTHNELLQRGGHYAELYNTYFRHQSIAYIEGAKNL